MRTIDIAVLAAVLINLLAIFFLDKKIRNLRRLVRAWRRDVNKKTVERVTSDGLKTHFNSVAWPQFQGLIGLYRAIDNLEVLPPLRSWAMSPDLLLILALHVKGRGIRAIVECGSGASTLALASILRTSNSSAHIWTLEDRVESADTLREELQRRGLSDYVTICLAPLTPRAYDGFDHLFNWYNLEGQSLPSEIDLLVVDGPWGKVNFLARYPAGPELFRRLSPRARIFLDDANRPAERELLGHWRKLYPQLSAREIPTEKGALELFFV